MEYESIKGKTFASNKERYNWYIGHSIEWQEVRAKRLDEDGHQCQMCGTCGGGRNPLQVHHTSYDEYNKIGYDVHTGHLITLCSMCHHDVHAFSKDIESCTAYRVSVTVHQPSDSPASNIVWRAFAEARCGLEVIKLTFMSAAISTVIDTYFTRRCKELSPNGDINFFTGHPTTHQTVRPYIDGLLDLSPDADIRAICIQNAVRVDQFNYDRYNNVRCMVSDPKAPKKSRLAIEGAGYRDDSHGHSLALTDVLEQLNEVGSMDITAE